MGSSFTLFALPLLVFDLTHSATNLAITTASEFVPYLLFGLLLGALVDRVNRKRMMLLTDTARGAVILVLPVLALTGTLDVSIIYAVAFVQSTLGILFTCGEFAAIPSLVGRDDLVAANGRIMATNYAGQVVGPILAGALVALISPANLLFFDAGTFFVSALSLAVIRRSFNGVERPTPAAAGVRGLLADVREGLRYVWSNPILRSISIMMALINFVATTDQTQLVLFAKKVLHAVEHRGCCPVCGGRSGSRRCEPLGGAHKEASLFSRHGSRGARGERACHNGDGTRRQLCSGSSALGRFVWLRAPAQHKHGVVAAGDRAEPHVRAGHQHRGCARLVRDTSGRYSRCGCHQPYA